MFPRWETTAQPWKLLIEASPVGNVMEPSQICVVRRAFCKDVVETRDWAGGAVNSELLGFLVFSSHQFVFVIPLSGKHELNWTKGASSERFSDVLGQTKPYKVPLGVGAWLVAEVGVI